MFSGGIHYSSIITTTTINKAKTDTITVNYMTVKAVGEGKEQV